MGCGWWQEGLWGILVMTVLPMVGVLILGVCFLCDNPMSWTLLESAFFCSIFYCNEKLKLIKEKRNTRTQPKRHSVITSTHRRQGFCTESWIHQRSFCKQQQSPLLDNLNSKRDLLKADCIRSASAWRWGNQVWTLQPGICPKRCRAGLMTSLLPLGMSTTAHGTDAGYRRLCENPCLSKQSLSVTGTPCSPERIC